MTRFNVFVCFAVGLFAACGAEEDLATDAGVVADPTWHGEVAPIIAEHCQRCHEQGGIAPFPLTNYDQAKSMSAMIAASTAARRMPPFLADNSGDCNTWVDANWLSNSKLEILAKWHASGAQEGAPQAPPQAPVLPSIENPDLTVSMTAPYTPDDTVSDDYRCFILDPELDRERYVTRYQVVPGEQRVVHHVILYATKNAAAERAAQALADEDGRAGYPCYGGAGIPADMIAAWAPGTGATSFPEGTGLALRPQGKLIMQIHYNMASGSFPDQTSIKLTMRDQVDHPGTMTVLGNNDLNIPPGLENHVESDDLVVRQTGARVAMNLWGILPHMHEIGRTYRLERVRSGQTMCLMDVPRWDFNWQLGYFLDQPIRLEPTDILRTTCRFDSRSRDQVTRFGEDTTDEMCLGLMFATRAD